MKLAVYICRRFIPVFLGALVFFVFALELVDLLMNLWKYIVNQAPVFSVAHVLMLYAPKSLSYAVPLAVLFAASYTLSGFYANNELIAVFASGISLFRFTLPLLLLSLLLSFGEFFFEDTVVVPTYAKKQELQKTLLKQTSTKNNDRIVVLSEGGACVYKAEFYEDSTQRLYSLYVVLRSPEKKLEAIIFAESALWDHLSGHWVLSNSMLYVPSDTELLRAVETDKKYEERLVEPPETFRNNTISVEEVNTSQAREYIHHLMRTGLPYAEALSLYYKKYSFPFVLFIVVFLSIGLSGKTRKNVLLMSFALSIGAAVLFYVTQMVTMLFAKFGYISPFAGAWTPVILFVIISIILLRFART